MRSKVSFSELKTFGWCEKWYQNKYVDLLPSVFSWGFSFYAGTVLDEYVKSLLLKTDPEEAKQKRLFESNFVGFSSDKDEKSNQNAGTRLLRMAEQIVKQLPPDTKPGGNILEPWDLDGTGNMLVTLDGWPDFVSEKEGTLYEMKCQLRSRTIQERIKDWFQADVYRMALGLKCENTYMIETVVSGAAKPKGPEYKIDFLSMTEAQEEIRFQMTEEVVELFRRLVSSREKKVYARTGIMTGACKFCSFKSSCFNTTAE